MDPCGYAVYGAKALTDALTVPKNRRPRFDLTLRIIDLNNIPLVVGTASIKWHLPSSTSAEHRGLTDKALIQDHRASWDYVKTLPVRLTIDRNQMLQECEIFLEIMQEFASGSRGDRMSLGNIRLNLAEYVDQGDDQEGVTRRYLVQDSKVNCTLKVGILMHQVEGDTNFTTPPLRTAMVFGGIAGVIEQGESVEAGRIPSITNRNRELGDMQDMYRCTLAASWACRAGELPPDLLIEDIFAGGDGWRRPGPRQKSSDEYDDTASLSDTDSRRTIRGTPGSDKQSSSPLGSHRDLKSADFQTGGTSRGGLDRSLYDTQTRRRKGREVSEFDVREDLRSWEISTPYPIQ